MQEEVTRSDADAHSPTESGASAPTRRRFKLDELVSKITDENRHGEAWPDRFPARQQEKR